MFACAEAGQRLVLDMDNAEVLSGIGMTARLYEGAQVPLALLDTASSSGTDHHGAFTETICRFGDEAETVRATLRLVCRADRVAAYVAGETVNANVFGSQRTFAPERGLTVTAASIGDVRGLLASYQHKDWWTRPYVGTDPAGLPERTQSLLWRTDEGFRYLLPVCGETARTDVAGSGEGIRADVSAHASGLTRLSSAAFVLLAGADPYALAEEAAAFASEVLEGQTLPRSRKRYPEQLDYLGWCSWDAFYHEVNEEGLLRKAEELNALGLPVRWVMIDDGWSDVRDGKLYAFDANPGKFPEGLGRTVNALKTRHGVRWVGVWHTIAGYWGGVHPEGAPAARLPEALYRTARGQLVPYPDAARGFAFWHAWHGELQRMGVDFVKVDSQSAVLHFHRFQRPVGEAASAAHSALEASIGMHFGGTVINCMGMGQESVWHRPSSAVSRSSDDFVPQEKGFREHALQNGYNSFYHGPLYWGDWDMYWSDNHDDVPSSVLRAVSGGPVYISDAPGRTNPANIRPLIYEDGRLLRCDRPANPTADCLMKDPVRDGVPLKLWNTAGGAGVVAAFHIGEDESPLEATVGPADVPGLDGARAAVYGHFGRSFALADAESPVSFRLEPGQSEIFAVVPLRGDITPIGLIDKYVPPHAVEDVVDGRSSVFVSLRGGGRFAFHAEEAPAALYVDGAAAAVTALGDGLYAADCSAAGGGVRIEIVRGRREA